LKYEIVVVLLFLFLLFDFEFGQQSYCAFPC